MSVIFLVTATFSCSPLLCKWISEAKAVLKCTQSDMTFKQFTSGLNSLPCMQASWCRVDFFCKPWCRVDFFCKPWPSHWYNMLIGDYIIYKLWGLGFITEWCGHLWNTTCVVRISLEMLTHKVNCAINCFVRYRVKFRCRQQHCTISSFNQQSLICSVWLQSVLIELQE